MVTITSAKEEFFVESLIKTKGTRKSYCLGGMLDSNMNQYMWITGEKFKYNNWNSGEPYNYLERGENRLLLDVNSIGWNDQRPTGNSDPDGITLSDMGFVCEWDVATPLKPTIKKIVKKEEYSMGGHQKKAQFILNSEIRPIRENLIKKAISK